jgi:hypothetical protein
MRFSPDYARSNAKPEILEQLIDCCSVVRIQLQATLQEPQEVRDLEGAQLRVAKLDEIFQGVGRVSFGGSAFEA